MTDHPEALRERERIVAILRSHAERYGATASDYGVSRHPHAAARYRAAADAMRRAIAAIQEAPDNG